MNEEERRAGGDGKDPYRVVLEYEVQTMSKKFSVELPFTIGILADLKGEPDEPPGELMDRKIQPVDRDNFDDYMRWLGPRLEITVKDRIKGGGLLPVSLRFKSLADFSPEGVIKRIPVLRELLEKRTRAIDAVVRGEGSSGCVESLDEQLSQQLSDVMQHEDFQRLEASWRGLHILVKQVPPSNRIKFRVMSLSRKELSREARKYHGSLWDQSVLFHRLYTEEYGQFGGEPIGCYVADFEFDHQSRDVETLRFLAKIGAASDAPFLAGAAPSHLHLSHWSELGSLPDLNYQAPEFDAWRDLRDHPDSRFIGLTAPRFLARRPYGTGAERQAVAGFPYQEQTRDTSRSHCWANSAYLVASNIVRANAEFSWSARICGMDGDGHIDILQGITVPSVSGGLIGNCPMEVGVSDRRFAELTRLGLMVPVVWRNSGNAAFIGAQSLHQPPQYAIHEATHAALLGSFLHYLLSVCRIVHYLKCIARDCCYAFESRQEVEDYLDRWLQRYVDKKPDYSGAKEQAKWPLLAAQVILEPAVNGGEVDKVTLYCQPNYQLEGLSVSLRHKFNIYSPKNRSLRSESMHPKFIATKDADGRIVEIRKPSPGKTGEELSTYWGLAKEAVQSDDLDSLEKVINVLTPQQRSPEKLGELLHHVFIPWEARPPELYAHSQEIVRFLSEAGANMDHGDKNGHTLLYYLSYHSQCGTEGMGSEPINLPYSDLTVIPAEVRRNFLGLVETILECGADPNLVYDETFEHRTALSMATARPDHGLVECLLNHGADPLLPPSALVLAQAMGNQQLVDLLSRQRDSH